MDKHIGKKTVLGNLIWRFGERICAQGISFAVSIILARLIAPSEYGLISMVTVFTSLLQIFIDSGFSSALIQKDKADELDFSTVFIFNIVMCIALYTILYICSPAIAAFYDYPDMTPVIRVMGLGLIIAGVRGVQQAYISKNMLFKKFFFSTILATIISAVVGIVMAYQGFGVWALVAQGLVNNLIGTICLWCTVSWRPKMKFSLKRLTELVGFGWKILVSSLLSNGYTKLSQLFIGKIYSSESLAYYNKGEQLPHLLITNLNTSIDSVIFPAMAIVQNDLKTLKEMTRRAIRVSSYILWPAMLGLCAVATPLVRMLFTNTWIDMVPYLQIYCLIYVFQPIHTANLNAIKAMGKSDIFLKLEIMKKGIGLLLLFVTLWHGSFWIAVGILINTLISAVINAYPNRKLLNYSLIEQIKDIIPSIVMSFIMAICVTLIGRIGFTDVLTLVIQVISGIIIYFMLSLVIKDSSLKYIIGIIKEILKNKS